MKMKKWSLQWTQFMQLCKEAWKKKSGLQRRLNPWPRDLLVRCSTNCAMKPLTLGAGQLWVHIFPWKKWVLMINEINHIWTAEKKWRWRNDCRSERNLCNCVKKPEKKKNFRTSTWPWSPEFFFRSVLNSAEYLGGFLSLKGYLLAWTGLSATCSSFSWVTSIL